MDDTLRNPLAVEVLGLLDEAVVLDKDRPSRSNRQRVLIVADR
jgi:hypothetical protein